MRKFIVIFCLALISLFITGCASGSASPYAQITPSSYDFGEITHADGKVSKVFTVLNAGQETLIINKLSTSCGCTTAEIGTNEIAPGESTDMTVTFDPNVHPDDFGSMKRVVYLQTNSPLQKEIEVDISITITK